MLNGIEMYQHLNVRSALRIRVKDRKKIEMQRRMKTKRRWRNMDISAIWRE